MLPDMPEIKQELFEVQMAFFNWALRQESGAFQYCKNVPAYEGHQLGVERPTGESDSQDFWKLSSEIQIEPQKEDIGSSFAKIYDMGAQVGKQIERQSFAHLDRVLAEHDQVIDAKGKDMIEAMFELLEKIQIPLNDEGKLDMSNMVAVGEGFHELNNALQSSPKHRERFAAIMEKKELEERAREANRKLVG